MLIILNNRLRNKNNILITGKNGQLGSEINLLANNYTNYNYFFTDITELDITDFASVNEYVKKNKIDIIINCAAYTNVDNAELEPKKANNINNLAVANFAHISKERNIKLVHISTDYVFEGKNIRPYVESDITNPQSVYGTTKLRGEIALKEVNPKNSIIIRTSWLYSKFGENFIKTMLNLAETKSEINVVNDQIGSPTNAADLAKAILNIIPKIQNNIVEIYHYSNEGNCSWYQLAKAIFEIMKIEISINPIESKKYKTIAVRPLYSVLSNKKIKNKYNIDIKQWRESLRLVLQSIEFKKRYPIKPI